MVGAEYEGVGEVAAACADACASRCRARYMDTTLDSLNVAAAAAIVLERVFSLNTADQQFLSMSLHSPVFRLYIFDAFDTPIFTRQPLNPHTPQLATSETAIYTAERVHADGGNVLNPVWHICPFGPRAVARSSPRE